MFQCQNLSFGTFINIVRERLFFVLLFCIALRYFTGLSVVRPLYVAYVSWLSVFTLNGAGYADASLVTILIVIDILSKIQFNFSTTNIECQSINLVKIIHYLVFCLCIIIQLENQIKYIPQIIKDIICLVAFIFLIVLKSNSIMKNQNIKECYMRFYLLTIFFFAFAIISSFFKIQNLYRNIICILSSQIIYTLATRGSKGIPIEELLSKDHIIELSLRVLSYVYSNSYCENSQLAINKFLQRQSENHPLIRNQEIKKIGEKLLLYSHSFNGAQDLLLKSQIQFYTSEKIFEALKYLELALKMTSGIKFITKIEIYRMKQIIKQNINAQYALNNKLNFDDFIENQMFRHNIIQNSKNLKFLWDYIQSSEIIYDKLKKYLLRIVTSSEQLKHKFQKQLKNVCLRMSLMYIDYLYVAERDIKSARDIYERILFNQQFQANLKTENKVYIKFKIQQEGLVISRVGSNVKSLLGYSRSELQGHDISIFLPQFYREQHRMLSQQYLLNKNIYGYQKQTIIKLNTGFYQYCLLVLKLTYQDKNLELIGSIEIIERQGQDWSNYIIAREDTATIIQSSQSEAKSELMKHKSLNTFRDFHSGDSLSRSMNFKQRKQSFCVEKSDGIVYHYEQVFRFLYDDTKILFFALKCDEISQYESSKERIPHKKLPLYNINDYGPQLDSPKLTNFQDKNILNFLQKKQQTLQNINQPFSYILLTIIFITTVTILSLQIYSYTQISVNSSIKYEMINNKTNYLISHMMSIPRLTIFNDLLYIQQMFNYTNKQYEFNIVKEVQNIQKTNNKLKMYSIDRYKVLQQNDKYSELTVYHLVINVFSQLLSIFYQTFPSIKSSILQYIDVNQEVILIDSFDEYPNRMIQEISSQIKIKKINEIIMTVFACLGCISIQILVILLQKKNRMNEYETLQNITSLGHQIEWKQNIELFIKRITGDQNYNIMKNNETDLKLNSKRKSQKRQTITGLLSETTNRQNTLRDLINDTSRIQQSITDRASVRSSFGFDGAATTNNNFFSKSPNQSNEFYKTLKKAIPIENKVRLRSFSKPIIISTLVILILIIALFISKPIVLNQMGAYNQAQSVRNLVQLAKTNIAYSSIVSVYFSTISRNSTDLLFNKIVTKYQLNEKSLVSFHQLDSNKFPNFKQSLRKLRYNYICEYFSCSPQYKDRINIIYGTVIQKMVYYMQQTMKVRNSQPVTNLINKNNFDFCLLVYSEYLLSKIIGEFIGSYWQDFKSYNESQDNVAQALTLTFIIAFSFVIVLIAIGIYSTYKNIQLFSKYLNIVKRESYNLKDLKQITK